MSSRTFFTLAVLLAVPLAGLARVDLWSGARRMLGEAFSGMPALNHCLSCGACVEICEHMTRKQPLPAAMGFRSPCR